MKKKHQFFLTVAILLNSFVFAEQKQKEALPQISLPDTTTLLLSYVENDAELKNLTIAAKKAALSYKSTLIENGFDVTLSSGTITLDVSDDGTELSATPSVTAKLPQASNLSVSSQTKISSQNSETKLSDTSIFLGVDIISSAVITNKVTKLKAERSVTEAQRKIEKRAIAAEKEFYTELKKLLTSISSIISKNEKLYSDSLDLEAKKIQGYSQNSSTYRQAELKVFSDQHEIESAMHSFIYDCVVFYKKCGYDISVNENIDLMSLVPTDIEAIDPIDVTSFDKNLYSEIENANWTYKINSLERKSKKNISLSASAGYTFDDSKTKTDSIEAGLNGTIGGITLGAGVKFPIQGTGSSNSSNNTTNSTSGSTTNTSNKTSTGPTFTFSAKLSPTTFLKNNITTKVNSLTEEQELLAIVSAETNYETKVVELQQKLETLLWEKETAEKNLSMYEDLEKDMRELLNQGYISENDYLASKNELNSNIIKRISNLIDLIIYNDDVYSNFVNESSELN